MSDPVNLRRVRKRRRRTEDARTAEENRLRFGISGADRRIAEARKAIDDSRHAGHFISAPGSRETGDE